MSKRFGSSRLPAFDTNEPVERRQFKGSQNEPRRGAYPSASSVLLPVQPPHDVRAETVLVLHPSLDWPTSSPRNLTTHQFGRASCCCGRRILRIRRSPRARGGSSRRRCWARTQARAHHARQTRTAPRLRSSTLCTCTTRARTPALQHSADARAGAYALTRTITLTLTR